jgi:hypothetical protein
MYHLDAYLEEMKKNPKYFIQDGRPQPDHHYTFGRVRSGQDKVLPDHWIFSRGWYQDRIKEYDWR